MKRFQTLLIFHFFLMSARGQPPFSRVDSLLKVYYKNDQPGAAVGILKGHERLLLAGYGMADLASGTAISPASNFNIGSLTKQFTAYAVLQLYYEGKFSMRDTIGRFLKLPMPVASLEIGRLLSHSSGIPDHYAYVDTNLVHAATDADVLAAMQKTDSLYFVSGTHYRYSNTAYCLLGLMIEKISGLSYAEYLRKNVFRPLGMNDASVYRPNEQIKDRVFGYEPGVNAVFKKSDAAESIFFSTEADGGIYLSMTDYLKWCEAIESGKLARSRPLRTAWLGQTLVDTARDLWYGCGWFVQKRRDSLSPKIIYHTGFNGGFHTAVLFIPSMDYCIAVFSNRPDIDLEDLIKKINAILFIPDNSFIKSGPLESFIHTWPIFAPCKGTPLFSTSSNRNWNASGMALN